MRPRGLATVLGGTTPGSGRTLLVGLAAVLAAAVLLTGCGGTPAQSPSGTNGNSSNGSGTDENGTGTPATSLAPEGVGVLRVLAAPSLSEAFDLIRVDFETRNPRLSVVVSYGDSESLTRQAADVFAADDPSALQGLTTAGQPEKIGRLSVAALEAAANPQAATIFLDYLREAGAQRILIDTGVLRP